MFCTNCSHDGQLSDETKKFAKAVEEYRNGNFDSSAFAFESVNKHASNDTIKYKSAFNAANSYLKLAIIANESNTNKITMLNHAIEGYIQSLKIVPANQNAKYNLFYALCLLRLEQNKNSAENSSKISATTTEQLSKASFSKNDAERIFNILASEEKKLRKNKSNNQSNFIQQTEKPW
jgi:hypothetical protein